jgi:hypothetical protein
MEFRCRLRIRAIGSGAFLEPYPLHHAMRAPWQLFLAIAIASLAAQSGMGAQPQTDPFSPAPEISPSLAALLEQADRDALHEDPQWLALVHYEKNRLSSGVYSPAITPGFFLSERGDRDPRAELHATLLSFFDPTPLAGGGERPQCAFIARRQWLTRRLGPLANALPALECPEYERWRSALDAKGLTLIFPEGFMNNPASIFGHTLLRVDASREGGSDEILGYAIDFTADTGDDGGLVYMSKGIAGFYPAYFNLRPYYEQLKRYADWENRDIWEYRLGVDQEQVDFLLMHLWELKNVEFPYYFFTKNCSYELLRLLEIGIANFDASAQFRGPVLPVDTVRAFADQPHFVKSTRYRASPETKLRAGLRSLAREDRRRVRAIVEGRIDPTDESLKEIPPPRHARVLDLAYAQLRYDYLAGNVSDEDSRGLSRRILIARSRVSGLAPGEAADAPEVEVPNVRPDQGHDTSLVSLAGGWRDDESFIDFQFRPALHRLLDNGGGYPEFMEVRILDTRLRVYPESGRVRLQELTLFETVSLSPRSHAFKPWAWSTGTGLRTRRVRDDGELDDAAVWGTHLGAGLAWDPHPIVLLYGLSDLRLDVGPDLENSVSFGPGARLGVYLGKREARWKGHLFGEVTYFAAGETTTSVRGGAELRLKTSRNTSISLEGSINRIHGENWADAALRLNLHF